jgi:hypothetical protein
MIAAIVAPTERPLSGRPDQEALRVWVLAAKKGMDLDEAAVGAPGLEPGTD